MKEVFQLLGIVLLLAAIIVGPQACNAALTKDDIAIRALQEAGYTDVHVIDKEYWFVGCQGGHKDDAVMFVCSAVNPIGQTVEINVYVNPWPFQSASIRTR